MLFYDESVKLYEDLSSELDFNVMFSQRGHLTLRTGIDVPLGIFQRGGRTRRR